MPSSPIPHILFSASAGSGKTYQLVRRYVQLLMLGQSPDAISAMTFTRKAAGEFFNRILRSLAELSRDEEAAVLEYLDGLKPLPQTLPSRIALLREIGRNLHRLRLGTLDSFFAQVTTCFPLELGLSLNVKVMSEDEADRAAVDAMEALLDRIYRETGGTAALTVLEAFKQGTFGAEEKSAQASLLKWIQSGHDIWLDSKGKGWGDLSQLGGPFAGGQGELRPLGEVVADLAEAFPETNAKGQSMLDDLVEKVGEFEPGMSLSKRVQFFVDKCHAAWDDLQSGEAQIAWGKKVVLEGESARFAVELIHGLLRRDLAVRAERTRGRAKVLAVYEEQYAKRVRSAGQLSFADVQRLLASHAAGGAEWMTGDGSDLWYRMDGRFDHWLLDEFQDTSAVQWRVLRGLVDEVMQDDSGSRSFFAVGDPKQSIYLWREAMPGLFQEVLDEHPHEETTDRGLEEKGLSQSWRSAKSVLDAVNQVFGDRAALEALLPGSLEGWSFESHVAARAELSGSAALLSPVESEATEDVISSILAEVAPLDRSLTCAILVRSNHEGRSLTEFLRKHPKLDGMEIVCESNQCPATDNAATLALLSLLQWAAHPSDSKAREHLRMTPLWALIATSEKSPEFTAARVRRAIDNGGFAQWLKDWVALLKDLMELDPFHRHRLGQLREMAAEFDAQGSRDIDGFLRFVRDKPVKERSAGGAVQVMTVHAAKGLEFDVVIVTQLGGTGLNVTRPEALLTHRTGDRVDWVLEPPGKALAQFSEALREQQAEESRLQGFEALCRLYVAMTRAKRGLYLVADRAPKSGSSVNAMRLLRERLGQDSCEVEIGGARVCVEWETGDRSWFASRPQVRTESEPITLPEPVVPLGVRIQEAQPIARRRTPSGEETFRVTGAQLFSEGREPGRRLGSLVHLLLSEIPWWGPNQSFDTLYEDWLKRGLLSENDSVSDEALRQVRQALGSAVFIETDEESKLWRERSFDLIVSGEWISGVFDRVEIRLGTDGKTARSARVVDFKTDEIPGEEELVAKIDGYRPQLKLYREAVARLTGLEETAIELCLLFTRTGRLETVDA